LSLGGAHLFPFPPYITLALPSLSVSVSVSLSFLLAPMWRECGYVWSKKGASGGARFQGGELRPTSLEVSFILFRWSI